MDPTRRYQFQPWYVKLWRRRHYLSVPFNTLRIYLKNINRDSDYSLSDIWGIEIGLADMRMEWWHTSEEVLDELKNRREKRNGRKGKDSSADPV